MTVIMDLKFKECGKDKLYNLTHSHRCGYEILFVHSGKGNIVIADKLLELTPGVLYFIDESVTHCTIPDEPDKYCRSLIVMSKETIDKLCKVLECEDLLSSLFGSEGVSVFPVKANHNAIEDVFENVKNAFEQNDSHLKSIVTMGFLNIMFQCKGSKKSLPVAHSDSIAKVLRYINIHLSDEIKLDEICNECHMSKFYLCHLFKKKIGMTIIEYTHSRRMNEARNMLCASNLPISQIAIRCGFSSFAYFGKLFKEKYGMTPMQFRKNY